MLRIDQQADGRWRLTLADGSQRVYAAVICASGVNWDPACANLLTRALPLFARSAARGHRKYLASLQQRGLIRPRQGGWEVVPPPHREDPHTPAATQATTQRT